MSRYRILGVNDDITTCECCGKTNLKCTVVLTDGEHELAYGRDCAAKAIRPVVRNGQVVGASVTALKVQRWAEEAKYEAEKAQRLNRKFEGLKR